MWEVDIKDTASHYPAKVLLHFVAHPQPIALQQNDGEANYGWKCEDVQFNFSIAEGDAESLDFDGTTHGIDSTSSNSITVAAASGCVWDESDTEDGHANGTRMTKGGYVFDGPRVNKIDVNIDMEAGTVTPSRAYPATNAVAVCFGPDTAEDGSALKYEVGACHPQTIPTGYAGWTPFDSGESCSTYEMAVLLAHNTNRVNFCTCHRQSTYIGFEGGPTS
jgi:hypothetical protein